MRHNCQIYFGRKINSPQHIKEREWPERCWFKGKRENPGDINLNISGFRKRRKLLLGRRQEFYLITFGVINKLAVGTQFYDWLILHGNFNCDI